MVVQECRVWPHGLCAHGRRGPGSRAVRFAIRQWLATSIGSTNCGSGNLARERAGRWPLDGARRARSGGGAAAWLESTLPRAVAAITATLPPSYRSAAAPAARLGCAAVARGQCTPCGPWRTPSLGPATRTLVYSSTARRQHAPHRPGGRAACGSRRRRRGPARFLPVHACRLHRVRLQQSAGRPGSQRGACAAAAARLPPPPPAALPLPLPDASPLASTHLTPAAPNSLACKRRRLSSSL